MPYPENNNGVKFWDDKSLVIIAVTVIALAALFKLDDPTTIISSIASGLFGVAVGKNLNGAQ